MNEPEGDEEPEDDDSAQDDDDDEDEDDDDGVPQVPILQNQQAHILDEMDDYGMEEAEDDYDEEEPVND